jgi:hypothetical protein
MLEEEESPVYVQTRNGHRELSYFHVIRTIANRELDLRRLSKPIDHEPMHKGILHPLYSRTLATVKPRLSQKRREMRKPGLFAKIFLEKYD